MYECMYTMYVCLYVFTYVYLYICIYVYTYVCTYVCIYVCIYVHMHECMYVRTYICICMCTYAEYMRIFGIMNSILRSFYLKLVRVKKIISASFEDQGSRDPRVCRETWYDILWLEASRSLKPGFAFNPHQMLKRLSNQGGLLGHVARAEY